MDLGICSERPLKDRIYVSIGEQKPSKTNGRFSVTLEEAIYLSPEATVSVISLQVKRTGYVTIDLWADFVETTFMNSTREQLLLTDVCINSANTTFFPHPVKASTNCRQLQTLQFRVPKKVYDKIEHISFVLLFNNKPYLP